MKKINLRHISTLAPKGENKEKVKKELEHLKGKLGELQNLLFAEGKHALLVVIQGMDASGKDGAVKNVFDAVNPMGCNVIAFKQPTQPEAKHDFLWRIHQHTPPKGMLHIFNRSHYEDVLIQKVHQWVDGKTIHQRYDHINNFEKLLTESNTTVLKFYLHISKKEQLERLQARLSDPTKKWKHNDNDIKEREYWKEYMEAYETVFEKCSKHSKWHIVPSDQNWYKEFYMAKIIVETLKKLKMKYPGLKGEQ
jgi:PPK2 family polyphosphate:nucleotide phosphotransferase